MPIVLGLLASCGVFASTNIDAMLLACVWHADGKSRRHVVLGYYLTAIFLLLVSWIVVTIGLHFHIPLFIFGIVPILIGTIRFIKMHSKKECDDPEEKQKNAKFWITEVAMIFGIGIASGFDNLSVYIPFFSANSLRQNIIYVIVSMVGTGGICCLSHFIVKRPHMAIPIKYLQKAMPCVLILIGIYVLTKGLGILPV